MVSPYTDAQLEAFRAERGGKLGGSDAPVIAGVSKWKGILELFAEFQGLTQDEHQAEHLEWGHRLEPVILQKFADDNGVKIHISVDEKTGQSRQVVHRDLAYMACHPDGWALHPDHGLGIVQAKSTQLVDDWDDGTPLAVHFQIQHELAVVRNARDETPASLPEEFRNAWPPTWAAAAVLFTGWGRRYLDEWPIVPHDRLTNALLAKERDFIERVARNDPPPATHPKDSLAMDALYRNVDVGSSCRLPAEAADVDDRLRVIAEHLKALGDEKETLRAQIKAWIGNHAAGILPGASGTWTWNPRKAYTRKASEVKAGRTLRRSTK